MKRFAVLLAVAIVAGCGSGVRSGAMPPSQLAGARGGRETAAARRQFVFTCHNATSYACLVYDEGGHLVRTKKKELVDPQGVAAGMTGFSTSPTRVPGTSSFTRQQAARFCARSMTAATYRSTLQFSGKPSRPRTCTTLPSLSPARTNPAAHSKTQTCFKAAVRVRSERQLLLEFHERATACAGGRICRLQGQTGGGAYRGRFAQRPRIRRPGESLVHQRFNAKPRRLSLRWHEPMRDCLRCIPGSRLYQLFARLPRPVGGRSWECRPLRNRHRKR